MNKPFNINRCRTRSCVRQHTLLKHVQNYVDPRAHLVHGEIRYSIKLAGKWVRRVLKSTEIKRIFGELYP